MMVYTQMGNLKLNCFVPGMSEFVHYTPLYTFKKKTIIKHMIE